MPPLRIAFGCQARVGKDTACEYLKNKYGGNVYHFSDPLYDILYYAQDVCGFKRKKDVKFLQWIGTEWGRELKDTVWVDSALNRIDQSQNCFIADLRFRNEIKELKQYGFRCVRIVRNDRPIDRNASHASEVDLADYTEWDMVINNDDSLKDFYAKLDSLCESFAAEN